MFLYRDFSFHFFVFKRQTLGLFKCRLYNNIVEIIYQLYALDNLSYNYKISKLFEYKSKKINLYLIMFSNNLSTISNLNTDI